MGWGTLKVIWDGTRDPPKGLKRVGGSSRRSRTGRWTLPEVWVRLGDPIEGS